MSITVGRIGSTSMSIIEKSSGNVCLCWRIDWAIREVIGEKCESCTEVAAVGFRMWDEKCAIFCVYGKRGKKQLLSPHSTIQRVSFTQEYIFVFYNRFGAESFVLLCYLNKWHKYNFVFFIRYNTFSFTQQEENWLSTFKTGVSRKTNVLQCQEVKWKKKTA